MTKVFNYRKFYLELNRQRKIRGNIAWNKVATRAGLSPSTLSRFVNWFEDSPNKTFRQFDLESVIKLLDWMNQTDLAPYIVDESDPDATL